MRKTQPKTTTTTKQPNNNNNKAKSIYKHLHFSFLPTTKTRTVNIPTQKFNKHNYTKDSPEHDFIC